MKPSAFSEVIRFALPASALNRVELAMPDTRMTGFCAAAPITKTASGENSRPVTDTGVPLLPT